MEKQSIGAPAVGRAPEVSGSRQGERW